MNRETYVDRPETRTVTCSHVLVEALDRISAREFTELLVHVVCTTARVVANPDTKVLDLQRLALKNLRNTNDLAVRLLHFLELPEEVPETRFGDNLARGEDAHTVELGGRLSLGGQMAANDLVFLQATCWATVSALSDGQYVRRHVFRFHVMRDHHYSSERKHDA